MNEECWIIYGHQYENFLIGEIVYESLGSPASVEFDWEKAITERIHLIGFNHTHPSGIPHPSNIDCMTMAGWVKVLGKPLLCGIKSDEQKFFLFERFLKKISYKEINFTLKNSILIAIME